MKARPAKDVEPGDKVVIGARQYLCRGMSRVGVEAGHVQLWYNGRWNTYPEDAPVEVIPHA